MPEMKQWSQEVPPGTEVKEAEVAHEFPLWKPGAGTEGGKVNGSPRPWLLTFSSGLVVFGIILAVWAIQLLVPGLQGCVRDGLPILA